MNPEALRLLRNVAQRLFASIIADISPSDDQLLVVKDRDIVDIVIRNFFDEFILPIARHLATVDFKRPNLAARPTPLISITVLTKHISGCIQPEIPPVSFRLISLDPNAIDSLLIGLSVKIIARNTKIINATAQALLSLLAIICNDWLEYRLLADHFAAYPHSAMFGDFPTGINTSGFAALKNNRTSRDVYGWLSEYEKWRATVIRPLLKAFCASDEDCFESEGGGGQIFGAAADIPGILNSHSVNTRFHFSYGD
jgi:hypothetical protein